jgi:hypothetical protein
VPSSPTKTLWFWAFDATVSADEVIGELHTTPHIDFNPNQSMTLDGIEGIYFDGTTTTAIAIPALGKLVGHEGGDWEPNSAFVHLGFIVLHVNKHTLLVYLEAPKDEWAAFLPAAQQVLTTVKFGP